MVLQSDLPVINVYVTLTHSLEAQAQSIIEQIERQRPTWDFGYRRGRIGGLLGLMDQLWLDICEPLKFMLVEAGFEEPAVQRIYETVKLEAWNEVCSTCWPDWKTIVQRTEVA